jgi:tRNA(adenine34) deaminase
VGSNPTSSAMNSKFEAAMRVALEQAELAAVAGDVPVGAVVLHERKIIAARHNEREATNDPTAHAEVLVLRDAASVLGTWHLDDCILVVTLEPCIMCAGALLNARVKSLVFGAADLKAGATSSLYNVCSDPRLNHNTDIIHGVLSSDCEHIITNFFKARRGENIIHKRV